jgi:RNA polymerase sigma-70 factor, ECF subfamily
METVEVAEPLASDLDVLAAAREGSEEAARRLVAEQGPSMLRTAWHVMGRYGGTDAEDVVQEAFIAALTTGAPPRGDVGAWLRAIAARKALDWMRGVQRRSEGPLPEAAVPPLSVETLAVREALARLSPPDRAVLVLVDLEGHSMADAARTLGTTNLGVRLRAVRARRKLAKLLQGGMTS